MSPSTPYPPYTMPNSFDPLINTGGGGLLGTRGNGGLHGGSRMPYYPSQTPTTPTVMSKLEKWGQER